MVYVGLSVDVISFSCPAEGLPSAFYLWLSVQS